MTESPPKPGSGRTAFQVRLGDLGALQRFFDEQIRAGTLFIAAPEPRASGTAVEVVVSVGHLEAVLRLTGRVAEALPHDPPRAMRIALDDPGGAVDAAESYIAFAGSVFDDPSPPPAPPPERDRRHATRVSSRVSVRLRFSDAEQFRNLYTKDVSAGGIFVLSDDPRPPGSLVEVVLQPPGAPSGFALTGVVSHSVPPGAGSAKRAGMGIRFDSVPEALHAEIESYLRSIVGLDRGPAEAAPAAAPVGAAAEDGFPEPERREDVRLQARLQLKLRPADFRRFRELYTRDISRGGVFVYSDHPHPEGSPVEVLFYAPGLGEPFAFDGEVVRVVRPTDPRAPGELPGMGIRFHRVEPKTRDAIEEILSRVLEDDLHGQPGPPPPPRAATPPPLPPRTPTPPPEMPRVPAHLSPKIGVGARFVPPPAPRRTPVPPLVFFEDLPPPPETVVPPLPSSLLETPAASQRPRPSTPAPVRAAPRAARSEVTVIPAARPLRKQVELRRDLRDPHRTQAVVRFATVEELRETYERDLSQGGVFLATEEALPLRSRLDVILVPPGARIELHLAGEVVHLVSRDRNRPDVEPGMGIQLLDLTGEKKADIEACLEAGEDPLFDPLGAAGAFPDAIAAVEPPPAPERSKEDDFDRMLDEAFMDVPGEPIDFAKIERETEAAERAGAPRLPRR